MIMFVLCTVFSVTGRPRHRRHRRARRSLRRNRPADVDGSRTSGCVLCVGRAPQKNRIRIEQNPPTPTPRAGVVHAKKGHAVCTLLKTFRQWVTSCLPPRTRYGGGHPPRGVVIVGFRMACMACNALNVYERQRFCRKKAMVCSHFDNRVLL